MTRLVGMAVLAVSILACAPSIEDGAIECSDNGRCPPGFECEADGRCWRGGRPAPDAVSDGTPDTPTDSTPDTTSDSKALDSVPDAADAADASSPDASSPDAAPVPDSMTDSATTIDGEVDADNPTPDATTQVDGCTPTSCTSEKKNCGTISDGCGKSLDCGSCIWPESCGGGGTANVCGCTPTTTCEAAGAECGTLDDGCGGKLDCGTCIAPEACGGGGTPNVCGCTPTTCEAADAECGTVSDGCGRTLSCRGCAPPELCGGGGANVCGAPSCVGLAPTCGPTKTADCCETLAVSGGTYNRSNDPAYPATVSDFMLDRYEITVGRFRNFVEAGMGTQASPPAAGDGAHPSIVGSGWDSAWNTNLQADTAALEAAVKCDSTYQTWTDTAGANESLPMNCLDWYDLFAFCAWDGGRLPTEAEWNYAAAGGSEQRQYPWGNAAPDGTYAVFDCLGNGSPAGSCAFTDILVVGSRSPKGDGKWGHSDLAGSVWEWTLDWYNSTYPTPCVDCANLVSTANRSIRGGGFSNFGNYLASSYRNYLTPTFRYFIRGGRCARTP
ncbi:MAG: formylglycine-generating enzyme family protein [Pseudomonadota bacterium]